MSVGDKQEVLYFCTFIKISIKKKNPLYTYQPFGKGCGQNFGTKIVQYSIPFNSEKLETYWMFNNKKV